MSADTCCDCGEICFQSRECTDGVIRFVCDRCYHKAKVDPSVQGLRNRADRRAYLKSQRKGNKR